MSAFATEEHEGPYLKVGQISGPGGLGLQVGSGRRRPLDTPPALTLTADVQKEVLEVLTDWQGPSLSRLEVGYAEAMLLYPPTCSMSLYLQQDRNAYLHFKYII